MARRNHKAKRTGHTSRALASKSSRSRARRPATPSGRPGKTHARRPAQHPPKPKRRRRTPQQQTRVRIRPSKSRLTRADPRIEAAILEMNRGSSFTAAARALRLPPKDLQRLLSRARLLKRKGKRRVLVDNRLRRVPVMTGGGVENLTVRGYEPARLVGEHHHAVGEFVRTNDPKPLKPFEGRTVQAVNGRRYTLETDPNALHRIHAMDSPPFYEIYEFASNT